MRYNANTQVICEVNAEWYSKMFFSPSTVWQKPKTWFLKKKVNKRTNKPELYVHCQFEHLLNSATDVQHLHVFTCEIVCRKAYRVNMPNKEC